MKVLINSCFGGFGLSDAAMFAIAERKGLKVIRHGTSFPGYSSFSVEGANKPFAIDNHEYYTEDEGEFIFDRTDPDAVAVVEELGSEKASDSLANVRVVEIPDDVDWYIHDYDGIESVNEKHRSWS